MAAAATLMPGSAPVQLPAAPQTPAPADVQRSWAAMHAAFGAAARLQTDLQLQVAAASAQDSSPALSAHQQELQSRLQQLCSDTNAAELATTAAAAGSWAAVAGAVAAACARVGAALPTAAELAAAEQEQDSAAAGAAQQPQLLQLPASAVAEPLAPLLAAASNAGRLAAAAGGLADAQPELQGLQQLLALLAAAGQELHSPAAAAAAGASSGPPQELQAGAQELAAAAGSSSAALEPALAAVVAVSSGCVRLRHACEPDLLAVAAVGADALAEASDLVAACWSEAVRLLELQAALAQQQELQPAAEAEAQLQQLLLLSMQQLGAQPGAEAGSRQAGSSWGAPVLADALGCVAQLVLGCCEAVVSSSAAGAARQQQVQSQLLALALLHSTLQQHKQHGSSERPPPAQQLLRLLVAQLEAVAVAAAAPQVLSMLGPLQGSMQQAVQQLQAVAEAAARQQAAVAASSLNVAAEPFQPGAAKAPLLSATALPYMPVSGPPCQPLPSVATSGGPGADATEASAEAEAGAQAAAPTAPAAAGDAAGAAETSTSAEQGKSPSSITSAPAAPAAAAGDDAPQPAASPTSSPAAPEPSDLGGLVKFEGFDFSLAGAGEMLEEDDLGGALEDSEGFESGADTMYGLDDGEGSGLGGLGDAYLDDGDQGLPLASSGPATGQGGAAAPALDDLVRVLIAAAGAAAGEQQRVQALAAAAALLQAQQQQWLKHLAALEWLAEPQLLQAQQQAAAGGVSAPVGQMYRLHFQLAAAEAGGDVQGMPLRSQLLQQWQVGGARVYLAHGAGVCALLLSLHDVGFCLCQLVHVQGLRCRTSTAGEAMPDGSMRCADLCYHVCMHCLPYIAVRCSPAAAPPPFPPAGCAEPAAGPRQGAGGMAGPLHRAAQRSIPGPRSSSSNRPGQQQ